MRRILGAMEWWINGGWKFHWRAHGANFSWNNAVSLGGTANLAVLGGNLPPSRTLGSSSPFSEPVMRAAVGLVARQNRPVARSTLNSTEWFPFRANTAPQLFRQDAGNTIPECSRQLAGCPLQPVLLFLISLLLLSATSASSAELTILSSNTAPPTVGLEGRIEVLLPPDLKTVAADNKSPLLLRIASTRPHGSMVHYDLRYIGRIPGQHDLREYLLTQENVPATNLPSIAVEVVGILPKQHNGWLEDQALHSPSIFGGYRGIVGTIVVVWALLFFPLFFLGRKKHEEVIEEPVVDLTLADRMKPLVEMAAAGSISDDDKAALERMLITHWQRELRLDEVDGERLIPKIREHEEAGTLLRALEDWLHRPPGSVEVNIDELLEPYRHPPKSSEVIR